MANASIVLVGLGASWAVPGTYVELDFAKGPSAGNGAPRTCLLMGNKTSAGTATADTVVYGPTTQTPCQSESDVIGLFGQGSQLHRMFLRFVKAAGPNNTTPLFFLAVTASAGSSATLTESVATTALSPGNHRTWCVDQFVDTSIATGDTASVIATNISNSVNSQINWPITATPTAGAIAYTAKIAGPEGNWIRMQAQIQPGSGTIGTTTTLTANTFLTGGTTADVNTTALTTILGARYYYIVSGDSDATNVGRLVTQVASQANPTTGIRQRVISGSMDTLANTITLATGINNPRAELVWGSATDCTPAELAAGAAGIYATLEQGAQFGVARKNYSSFPTSPGDASYWPFIGGRAGIGGAPTNLNANSAILNGITTISMIAQTGAAVLIKRVTTYTLNGSVNDYRCRDGHIPTVCDYWCDDVQAMTQTQFGGRDLLPDPVQGQPPPPPQALTPAMWGAAIKNVTLNYGSAGQWSYPPGFTSAGGLSPAEVLNTLTIGPQIETSPSDRMSVAQPLKVVAICDQFALSVAQI